MSTVRVLVSPSESRYSMVWVLNFPAGIKKVSIQQMTTTKKMMA